MYKTFYSFPITLCICFSFFLASFQNDANGETVEVHTRLIGLYPTGDSHPESATSPLFIFEYKSEWITPFENYSLNIKDLQPRNWRGDWTAVTQSKKVLHDLNAFSSGSINEPFFLRCQLKYAGNLHQEALQSWYSEHPNEYPVNIPFPNQKTQESLRPEVLFVSAQGVETNRTLPKPSLLGRLFGAKTPNRVERDSETPPNVLILLIDTLRPDHTPPGGHPFIIAPHIDQMASLSAHFSNAYGASSSTRPSVGSIFTGLQPIAHGAVRHTNEGAALYFSVPLMAERFQRGGHQTAAVSSNAQVSPAFGFDRGFDEFESSVWESQVSDRGLAHLRKLDEPFFLYLHYMGPHQPYKPSYPYKDLYKGMTTIPNELPSSSKIEDASNALHDAYAEEITQEDRQIGRILKELSLQGLLERTVVWIVSDHGEEFWEHWWNGHGATVFEESVRTLSILSYPPQIPIGKTIETPIAHVDMLPTLFDLLGWKLPTIAHGHTLLPTIQGKSQPETNDRPIFLHHGGGTAPEPHPSDKEAILINGNKLIYWPQKHRWDFYDIAADSFEQKNAYREDDPSMQTMASELKRHLENCQKIGEKFKTIVDLDSPQLSPEEKENLKAFGYN